MICPDCLSKLDTSYHSSIFQHLLICQNDTCTYFFDIFEDIFQIFKYENMDSTVLLSGEMLLFDLDTEIKDKLDLFFKKLKPVLHESKNKFSKQFYNIYQKLNKVYDYKSSDLASDHFLVLLSHYFSDQYIKKLEYYREKMVLFDINDNSSKSYDRKVYKNIYIFDLDNTLRNEIDDTLIDHAMTYFYNTITDQSNKLYIASCNSKVRVNNWLKKLKIENVEVHAPLCSEGFKDLTPVLNSIINLDIPESSRNLPRSFDEEYTNKVVIGDSFKDMQAIELIRRKIWENPKYKSQYRDWYFIRSYFTARKLVDDWFKKNPNYGTDKNSDWYKWEAVYPFNSNEIFYNYDSGDLYFLPDACIAPTHSNPGVLLLEYPHLKEVNVFKNSFPMYISARYGSNFSFNPELTFNDTKFNEPFNVSILGRYFRQNEHNALDPRTLVAKEILDFKKNSEDLSSNIKENLEKFLELRLNSNYKKNTTQIVCTVPNSDGQYRFKDFLISFKDKLSRENTHILYDFILQTGEKKENHLTSGIQGRIENVKNKYIFNSNYPDLIYYISSSAIKVELYVIDDVITSGSTFNEINTIYRKLGIGRVNYNTSEKHDLYNEFEGIALGKHQSYPYSDRQSLIEYNYLPLNKDIYRDDINGFISDRRLIPSDQILQQHYHDHSYIIGH